MESTARTRTTATLTVRLAGLIAAFSTIPDPRREASVLYPLPAILTLAVAAILCARTSVLAIAEWGADQPLDLLQRLGFPDGRTPCQSTLHRLFRQLDGRALAAALGAYFRATTEVAVAERGGQGVAIDGKAQRGRLQYEPAGCPIHALTAFCQEQGVVLAQEPIEQGEDQRQAELTVAPELIAQIDWPGRVLTGDALYCQRSLCQQVLDAGGDYLLTVKANQPTLHRALVRAFLRPVHDGRAIRTLDKGHGRIEVRHLIASIDPVGDLDWPGLSQVLRVERTWWEKGTRRRQVRYGITSLPPGVGTPRRLLDLRRGHWGIENRLHRTKDVTLGEDASLVHTGQGPTIFALLRDTALSVLRRAGYPQITARLRHHSQYPEQAVALLLHPVLARA